jgi:signal transduction histidine kinase
VIVVQADGAAASVEKQPGAAAATLRTIGDTGREALGQMRRLLGVLRSEPDGAAWAPQLGTDQLDDLVAQVARAGLPAGLCVKGRPRPVTRTIDVTLYRAAQEALTNVLKHERDRAPAREGDRHEDLQGSDRMDPVRLRERCRR